MRNFARWPSIIVMILRFRKHSWFHIYRTLLRAHCLEGQLRGWEDVTWIWRGIGVRWYTSSVMGHWTLTIFYFLFFYFFWFYFSFSLFYFPGETMKKACDKEITWQVTWCDVIGLEHSRRVWKMTSGHLEYTWWPWVRSEVDMRMKHGL